MRKGWIRPDPVVAAAVLLVLGVARESTAQSHLGAPSDLECIGLDREGRRFVGKTSGARFLVWGVNYDRDSAGRLLEDYWGAEWAVVEEDFREIKSLGANVVRVHLQLATFMREPDLPNDAALGRLAELVRLAERTGLYLNLTGLGCYHKHDVPDWYDRLDETRRWAVQAAFWEAVARTCRESPAVFCYDLMNEPILPGKGKPESEWLAGEFGGKFFVQRLTLDLAGRSREDVARAWIDTLVTAIRKHDSRHLITVGVIPWALTFPGARPIFYAPGVHEKLDFVSIHVYPEKGKVAEALAVLKTYDFGKPLVIEETFPLKCGPDELEAFIDGSQPLADGWISFYWGTTADQIEANPNRELGEAILAQWLRRFQRKGVLVRGSPETGTGTPNLGSTARGPRRIGEPAPVSGELPVAPGVPCRIEVVEKDSGWPVPLVELTTTHHVRFVTDNAGVIAFDLPELMGRETWFDVAGHGYGVPRDGFGSRGVRLKPRPGQTIRVEVARDIVARRLGRITGAGLFGESRKLGHFLSGGESGVWGCDSVQTAAHRGRLFWFWGDTTVPHYRLGIFHATGAITGARPVATFEPPILLHFDPLRNERGDLRPVARMPGEGPTWLTACVSLPDADGRPRLVGAYVKVKPPLDVYRWGLCVWNDEAAAFEPFKELWTRSDQAAKPPPVPHGHAVFWEDAGGRRWVLFGNPFPTLRCPATFEGWGDPVQWEALAPQETVPVTGDAMAIRPHSGSIAWSPWRKRWVAVFLETFGKPSAFGEVWYAEADAPTGPWGPAVKVLSHDNYTFYNPRLHPELVEEGSPILIFEGTYTQQFANRPHPTPRYDYNQILYRLDLDNDRLAPARTAQATSP